MYRIKKVIAGVLIAVIVIVSIRLIAVGVFSGSKDVSIGGVSYSVLCREYSKLISVVRDKDIDEFIIALTSINTASGGSYNDFIDTYGEKISPDMVNKLASDYEISKPNDLDTELSNEIDGLDFTQHIPDELAQEKAVEQGRKEDSASSDSAEQDDKSAEQDDKSAEQDDKSAEQSYPIYDNHYNILTYGSYDDHIKSINNFKESPDNVVLEVDRYHKLVAAKVDNKYSGVYKVILRYNDDDKIYDYSFYR